MIPKIIHYCWFGDKEIPQTFIDYIDGWKKAMPEFEYMFWTNVDLPLQIPYISTAYNNKKWANLSNYMRLHAIYKYGGIYLDTDVELIKKFDELLKESCFFGIENQIDENKFIINNAIFGSVKKHWFIKVCKDNLLSKFDGLEDANESSPKLTTEMFFLKNKYIDSTNDIKLFPPDYFYPYHFTEKFNLNSITPNTYCIHHWAKTWQEEVVIQNKLKIKLTQILYFLVPKDIILIKLYGFKNWKKISKGQVVSGPFKGVRLLSKTSAHSSFYPKIFGTYESLLHEVIYSFLDSNYLKILNIGCDEGYYAIGLGKLFGISVDAYDIDSKSIQLAQKNVYTNNITNVSLFNLEFKDYSWESYKNQRNLVICDIEGDEIKIFNKNIISYLVEMDIIIELHDFMNYQIKSTLVSLFSETHYIEIKREKTMTESEKLFKNQNKLFRLIDERRPVEMEWLILKSKKYWN